MTTNVTLSDYFYALGIRHGQHILLHTAYRQISKVFPGIKIEYFLKILMNQIGSDGSLIMPAFTYNFRRRGYPDMKFHREHSPSLVGAVSETFRRMPGVLRTAGPTHSFCLWGQAKEIGADNSPDSPLGNGSVLEWISGRPDGYVCLIGVNFSALTFGHYLEHLAPVPWYDFSPWEHLRVEPIGVSSTGEQTLREIPGCSQSFVRFEKFLVDGVFIKPYFRKSLKAYHISVSDLLKEGCLFFRNHPQELLCEPGSCKACDERWEFYLKSIKLGKI